MNHDFLIGSAQLNQAFESHSSSGAGGNNVTRRSFIKRTGGATVAVFIAYNSLALAEVKDDTASNAVSKRNWLIKVDKVDFGDDSTGTNQPNAFDHDQNPETPGRDARKILMLSVSAPLTAYGASAESKLKIMVAEWAEYKANPTIEPDAWTKMSDAEFSRYRGTAQDQHEVEMSLKKSIDNESGAITTEKTPEEYDDTKENIHIKLSWDEDELSITYGSGANPVDETKKVEVIFHKKAHSVTM